MVAFNDLVEREIVRESLVGELGEEVFMSVLRGRLETVDQNQSLQEAAESLYGVDFASVMRHVFEPQATRDILLSKLLLRGESLDEWLAAKKKAARVKIYALGYIWEDGVVKER